MATAMAACEISTVQNLSRRPVASVPHAVPKSRQACLRASGPIASSFSSTDCVITAVPSEACGDRFGPLWPLTDAWKCCGAARRTCHSLQEKNLNEGELTFYGTFPSSIFGARAAMYIRKPLDLLDVAESNWRSINFEFYFSVARKAQRY